MKPAWDQLGDIFKDSTSVLIADVDCTAAGAKQACSDQGVKGYPTIKYFTAATGQSGEDYSGGRTFDALMDFVEKELVEECDVKTEGGCTEKEVGYIAKMKEKGTEKWDTEAKRLEGMLGQPMNDEKSKWLNQRINVLQQLLGRKVQKTRPFQGRWWLKWVLGAVGIGTATVLILVCCFRDSKAGKADEKKGEAAKAAKEAKVDKKED